MRNKKRCEKSSLIQAWLDNPSSQADKFKAEEHMANCDICKSEFEKYQKLFKKLDEEYAPKSCDSQNSSHIARLMKRIDEKSSIKHSSLLETLFALSFPVRAGLALSLVVFLIFTLKLFFTRPEVKLPEKKSVTAFNLLEMKTESVEYSMLDEIFANNISGNLKKDSFNFKKNITYTLNAGKKITMVLPSGKITFSNSASFSITEKEIDLLNGEVFCSFTGNHNGFKVLTPFGKIIPVGTSFSISLSDNFSKISLFSGKLIVENTAGIKKLISKANTIFLNKNGEVSNKPFKRNPVINNEILFPDNKSNKPEPARPTGKTPDSILDTL